MIRYYYRNLKSSQAGLTELDEYKPGAWVYLENPSAVEVEEITQKFGLEEGHIEDALDVDEVPRFEVEGKHNYVFTRFAYTGDDLQILTIPLLLILGDDIIITVSKKPFPRLERFVSGRVESATTQRTKLMLQLLDQIVEDYDTRLTQVSRQIKVTRARLRVEEIDNRDFIRFVTIEDELEDFLSALAPTNAILRRLLTGKHLKLFADDEDLIEDLLLNNEQSIESCRSSLKTIVNIREAYSTIMTNNLNRIIRQLTILTVVLTVPTIVSSLYGMNVALPLDHQQGVFWIIISIILLVSVLLLLFFRRQRWL